MNIDYILIDKDMSKRSKYVVTYASTQPEFVSTSSNGEAPIYISSSTYGKESIKDCIKLVGKEGHISTLFPTKYEYRERPVYIGDIRGTNDLLIMTPLANFTQCEILVFKDSKVNRWNILPKFAKGLLDELIEQSKQR
jgi:hypothetical protein